MEGDERRRDDSPGRESMTAKRVKEWACLREGRVHSQPRGSAEEEDRDMETNRSR